MKIKITLLFLFASAVAMGQNAAISPSRIIQMVRAKQAQLKTAAYTTTRTDTLVTGDVRTMRGKVMLEVDKADTLYGFKFWAQKDGEAAEKVYDGHVGYETNPALKNYALMNTSASLHNMPLSGGGHLLVPDLVRLDASGAKDMFATEDDKFYYLTINYPDLTKYDVIKRAKIITIDKTIMLPIAVRNHQETYGKAQDLYFAVTDLTINQANNYNFASPPFLKVYTQLIPKVAKDPQQELIGKAAPVFNLNLFDGRMVSTTDFSGKVVLLDFWEVWCGPCVESMPRVTDLFEKYKSKGLMVYGMTSDVKHLQSAKDMVKARGLVFPTLIGNASLTKDYKVQGVPLYVLIGKDGKIERISSGYPPDLEEAIVTALNR